MKTRDGDGVACLDRSLRTRMALVTDWRIREEDLPDVLPREEYECVITPQKHVTLCRILVKDLHLVRLRIGAAEKIPFRLEGVDNRRRGYSPRIDEEALEKLLHTQSITQPVAVVLRRGYVNEVAVLAGLDIHVTLRNERTVPVKPRAALLVREEIA